MFCTDSGQLLQKCNHHNIKKATVNMHHKSTTPIPYFWRLTLNSVKYQNFPLDIYPYNIRGRFIAFCRKCPGIFMVMILITFYEIFDKICIDFMHSEYHHFSYGRLSA